MSAAFWEQPARLMRVHYSGAIWKGARQPEQIAAGPLVRMVRQIAAEDPEDIWRFIIVTDDGQHIRSADLRALVRRSNVPGAERS
ncbi:hypothetical protein GG804_25375 [Sphingomonas histidinilytica]|jgi:hypothetical protein|uniref:Uncharacterized protein n=1 Tax=Rhizorhabdus histidinilytica TaxID=439228 RepID=A0A1T5FKM0_9SPHN|nr:hypothetical protein [Rhizorhabdus histidinilytica]MBO9380104.1 hypothetical protein [Rhizorhabdus histidinilytica]QEH79850.1 hypothetical protein EIK56_17605 [Sphingomonas sp. C8-2]SKB96720.1 hypothetical protein SAMN06295920_11010 [Rhizorhabdus histidinilytica]